METVRALIGPDGKDMLWWQMAIRAVITFAYALVLIRISGQRTFGKYTAFDIVVGVVLGSMLSRAITGNSPFFVTCVAAAALVAIHWAMAKVSLLLPPLGHFLKGKEKVLIEDGRARQEELRRNSITENDLHEGLRQRGVEHVAQVKRAWLERNGAISVIKKD